MNVPEAAATRRPLERTQTSVATDARAEAAGLPESHDRRCASPPTTAPDPRCDTAGHRSRDLASGTNAGSKLGSAAGTTQSVDRAEGASTRRCSAASDQSCSMRIDFQRPHECVRNPRSHLNLTRASFAPLGLSAVVVSKPRPLAWAVEFRTFGAQEKKKPRSEVLTLALDGFGS